MLSHWVSHQTGSIMFCPECVGQMFQNVSENKLQKLEDALVEQMLTAADRANQAERDDRTDLAEVAAG